jgi:hypothetical protein
MTIMNGKGDTDGYERKEAYAYSNQRAGGESGEACAEPERTET